MFYYANFEDINTTRYRLEINTSEGGLSEYELTLSDNPVIINQEGSDLFSPIKGTTCTINIESDGGLFDLYTTDPQGVRVVVSDLTNGYVIFRGYATPMQYSQDWTTIDTLSLECVDCVSSLKEMQYLPVSGEKKYESLYNIITSCFIHAFPEYEDSIFRWFRWYWPQHNFKAVNDFNFNNTYDILYNMSFNEANFFDDDDEQTPWTYWEVLEEICKYFNVSLVCYKGAYWFVDYLYAATAGNALFWQFDLDNNLYSVSLSKSMTFSPQDFSGGTSEVSTDDTYNLVAVNTNRYDIDEIVPDLYDEKKHVSINKEENFDNLMATFTHTETSFWWWNDDTVTTKYVWKKYCRLSGALGTDPLPRSMWKHKWWFPNDLDTPTLPWPYYYSTSMQAQSQFTVWPENKYINLLGATFCHYATIDGDVIRPTKLDWTPTIMFQVMTDTILPESTNTKGYFKPIDIDNEIFEVPAFEFVDDHEMNYSPHDGVSWINFNGKLWYQANWNSRNDPNWSGRKEIIITDLKEKKQKMYPLDECTDFPAHTFYYEIYNANTGNTSLLHPRRLKADQNYGKGFELLKCKLQIGDNYWNGSSWTTTESTFYFRFTYELKEGTEGQSGKRHFESFAHLAWLPMVSNTDFEDKVDKEGYSIPIYPEDAICGKLKLTIYNPRLYPHGYRACGSETYENPNIGWYEWCPIVFMKDFSVDYIYTDETEWWLSEEIETDDIKYINETKDLFKYTKENTLKINTWQEQRPISKSFPILNFIYDPQDPIHSKVTEYVTTIKDPSFYNVKQKQEYNIISRQLRHCSTPKKKYTCHRRTFYAPYSRVKLSDASELDGVFVIGSQEFNVKYRNNTVELIEFGDTQIYTEN